VNSLRMLLTACVLVAPSFAAAFDNERSGFMLGIGAGLHTIGLDFNYNGVTIASDSESGIATSFRIGWGFTDQFSLYYVRNASWYRAPYFDGISLYDTTFAVGIMGVGGTYYFSPSAPSAYFLGALGLGDISAPFDSDIDSDTGIAYMLGVGYEFVTHVPVELLFLSTDIESSDLSGFNMQTSSVLLTVNYLWY